MEQLKQHIEKLLNSAAESGVFTKASLTVVNRHGSIFSTSRGEVAGAPVTENTQFDIASVTKTVPVSTLALMALDQGKVSLDTPVSELVPELALKCSKKPLFRHLLTQTLDFGFSLAGLKHLPADQLLREILSSELKAEPGEKFYYCNATSIILGLAVEKLYGKTLDIAAEEYLFAPLHMNSSHFRPASESKGTIVPTEFCSWRGREVQGEIHDESAWTLNEIMIPGAAGLFSTTADLGRYVTMILGGGSPLFTQGFIDFCAENHIPSVTGFETALGFEFNQEYMGKLRSEKTVGKTGFTGSVIVADLKRGAGFALLTDYTWPKRKADKIAITTLRQECSDLIWGAVNE